MTTQTLLDQEQEPPTPPAVRSEADGVALMFERFATDPNVSVEKIERLMALWERGEARKAETAFNRALAAAQKEMRSVAADAFNPQTRSKYASYEALDKALRPIYTKHGFAVSFPGTGDAAFPEHVRVLCKLTHHDGHAERYHIDMPADGKGAKGGDVMTKTHAVASGVSYGMRYLLKMVFNVAVGEDDDDGNRAGNVDESPDAPKGFTAWWDDMAACADEGWPALSQAWSKSAAELRNYTTRYRKQEWNALKAKAEKVKK
jgi:hypothetical protein